MNSLSLHLGKISAFALCVMAFIAGSDLAFAQAVADNSSLPVPYQTGFQEPVTDVALDIQSFHGYLFWLITIVTVFVTVLLLYTLFRFRESANPVPSTNAHHTLLEVVWTIAPIVILLLISIPSFRLLYKQYSFPAPDVVIKATASTWSWEYDYPDEAGLEFSSDIVRDEDGNFAGNPRLLEVDNPLVVPVNKVVEVKITATDVLHNWTVPAFGVKQDAVPGRLLRTWFKATKKGTYYGQCSELCGKNHAFMPIMVRVVSEEDYKAWVVKAKEEFASLKAKRHYASRKDILKTAKKTAALLEAK